MPRHTIGMMMTLPIRLHVCQMMKTRVRVQRAQVRWDTILDLPLLKGPRGNASRRQRTGGPSGG